MHNEQDIRLNGDVIRRQRAAHGLSIRTLSRITDIRPTQLTSFEKGKRCEKATLGALFKLAAAICTDPEELLARPTDRRPPEPDDVKLEALLAEVGKAVNRDDIAWALDWKLERVNAAIHALEERLRETGQRVRRVKFGWFGLGAAAQVLSVEESCNIERATFSEYGIRRSQAVVLWRLAQGERWPQLAFSGKHMGGARNPIGELVRAGLVVPCDESMVLCEDVAFSLCVDDVRTAPYRSLKPRDRNVRASYSVHRVAKGKRVEE